MSETEQKRFIVSIQASVLASTNPTDLMNFGISWFKDGIKKLDKDAVIVITKIYTNEQGGER